MGDLVEVTLPPLVPGQAESWAALIELAESFGEDWMLVGGQLVFLLEVERGSTTRTRNAKLFARSLISKWVKLSLPSAHLPSGKDADKGAVHRDACSNPERVLH